MSQVIGPGASSGKSSAKTGKSMGPCGPGSEGKKMTSTRGYESRRFEGLRKAYKETGTPNNSKAGR